MVEQLAEITRTTEDQVWVKPLKPACQGCEISCSRVGVTKDSGIPLTVPDPHAWSPGDRVLLAMPESFLLATSLLVYGLPMLGLLSGAMLGASLAQWSMPDWREAWSVVGALVGFGSGLGVARIVRLHPHGFSQSVSIRPLR